MKQLILVLTIGVLIGCSGSPEEGKISKTERLEIINDLEKKAFRDVENFDTTMALALVTNYARYSDENPEDELTPNYLFKAGDLSMALHKPHKAISYFDRVIENYPDYEKFPYCMFLKGFVYEDQVRDLDKAKQAYEEFISKYPDHDMTEAAKFSLKNLGKSPEDLIREFEEKNESTPEES